MNREQMDSDAILAAFVEAVHHHDWDIAEGWFAILRWRALERGLER